MKYIVIIMMLCASIKMSAATRVTYTQIDSILVVNLLEEAKNVYKGDNLVMHFARKFTDIPYVAHTLEVNEKEQLVVNLRELDCTTYVETVLALALTAKEGKTSFADYCANLTKIRYRHGRLEDYSSRLHYFTMWIEDNVEMGIVSEIVSDKALFSAEQTVNATYMTTHSDKYKMLAGDTAMISKIALMEKHINGKKHPYLPINNIRNTWSLKNAIQDGDVIAIVTSKKGLEISHLGFAVWRWDGLHLLNASSIHHKVIEEPMTLRKYLVGRKTALGVRVLRLSL